jgi:hypothetical protein
MDTIAFTKQRTSGEFGEFHDALNSSLEALKDRNYTYT